MGFLSHHNIESKCFLSTTICKCYTREVWYSYSSLCLYSFEAYWKAIVAFLEVQNHNSGSCFVPVFEERILNWWRLCLKPMYFTQSSRLDSGSRYSIPTLDLLTSGEKSRSGRHCYQWWGRRWQFPAPLGKLKSVDWKATHKKMRNIVTDQNLPISWRQVELLWYSGEQPRGGTRLLFPHQRRLAVGRWAWKPNQEVTITIFCNDGSWAEGGVCLLLDAWSN